MAGQNNSNDVITDRLIFKPSAAGVIGMAFAGGLYTSFSFYHLARNHDFFSFLIFLGISAGYLFHAFRFSRPFRKDLVYIEVSKSGISGNNFQGKKYDLRWTDIEKARWHMVGEKISEKLPLQLWTSQGRIDIRAGFPKYVEIWEYVFRRLDKEGLKGFRRTTHTGDRAEIIRP